MEAIYRIPSQNLNRLQHDIEELNKRARRNHLAQITITVGEPEIEMRAQHDRFGYPTGHTERRIYFPVTIGGETPTIAGWTFIATLQHAGEAGNILRTLPGETLPASYREAPGWCDHCRTTRQRNETYVLRSDAGDLQQVGSSCVKDFGLHRDPHAVAKWAEILADAAALGERDEEFEGMGGGPRDYGYLPDFMANAIEACRRFGWVSRKAARESYDLVATADTATGNMSLPGDHKDHYEVTEESNALAAEVIEWVRGWDADAELSDYEHNLRVVMASDAMPTKAAGIAASAYPAYQRHLGREAERRARRESAATSRFLGEVGGKIDLRATVIGHREIDGSYGVTHLYRFLDDEGNRLSWFASSEQDIAEGDAVVLRATVKQHRAWEGIEETQVTRAKVAKVTE